MIFAFPQEAHACACCANKGQWSQNSQQISNFEFEEINKLQFSPVANLYQSAGDNNTGISSNSVNYTLSVGKKERVWNLLFKDKAGKTGTLSLTIPNQGVSFKTDLYAASKPTSADPQLYKELRLEGKVTGNGIFANTITPDTKFRLVLQGRGNNCLISDDFKTWNLQVFGPKANYAFYSSFK
ncbi:MAG: hypothetical protein IGS39_24550 [Calothrix sp. C42_A2020_038]|nr:hypothetical protein [Calothrix sp. C42_A2020_038]